MTVEEDVRGVCPTNMDEKAVNYLIKTLAGNVYHSEIPTTPPTTPNTAKGLRHRHRPGSYGENPAGCQDKMTSVDILRMAEALRCKVVIPFHYDVWTNFEGRSQEIMLLYNYKKHVLDYQFHPFIWDVGGKYVCLWTRINCSITTAEVLRIALPRNPTFVPFHSVTV